MKTLFISGTRPYPPRGGSPLRAWQNIRVLATRGPVSVFSIGERIEGADTMPGIERWIHINEDDYPERTLAGLARVGKLVRPRQFPLPNDHITGELNRRLRGFIDEIRPDIVVLSGWTASVPDAVRRFPRLVVDAHNVESLLQEELLQVREPPIGLVRRLQLLRFRQHERALFRQAARVWVCSRDDAGALRRLGTGLPEPVIWPNVVDVDAYADVRSGRISAPKGVPAGPPTIVFVGSYQYAPNARAAEALIETIFPLVLAREPAARLLLVGKPPTQRMIDAAKRDPRVVVTGSVDDVRPYLGVASVSAVALTEGGGTRLKILEAFAAGIPVVSTSKGAEGIAAEHGREILLADTSEAIAQAILDVFARPERYQQQAAAALALVRDTYSLETLQRRLVDALPPLETTNVPSQRSVASLTT
ncbi:MAG TPA: glycosyltransferase family 4 protein [Candidatus Lustribacter sp.]